MKSRSEPETDASATKAAGLALVLEELRAESASARKLKQTQVADAVDEAIDRVEAAARPFLTFHKEAQAMLRSSKSRPWLRARHATWLREGYARLGRNGAREYAECVLPHPTPSSIAREAGRQAATAGSRSA